MRTIIRLMIATVIIFLITSCDRTENRNILRAEGLLDTNPNESLLILENTSTKELSDKDLALYSLIKTQAQYKCDITAESDSLINIALTFYKSGKRHIQSLIFKGIVEYEIGNSTGAIDWLKLAEKEVDKNDYETLGYINMQLGNIYLDSYIENKEDIRKYKKALAYYTKSKNIKRCQVLNGIIGGSYRTTDRDSSLKYLNRAIKLDIQAKDSSYLFMHYEMMGRALYLDSDFVKSKDISVYSIKTGGKYHAPSEAIHDAARAYAQLGNIDSANYYLSQLEHIGTSPEEDVKLLTTKTIVLEKKGKYKEALHTYRKAVDIADSIVDSSHQQQLYLKEKLYDTQLLKSENESIKQNRLITTLFFIILILLLCAVIFIISAKKRQQTREMLLLQEKFQSAHNLAMEEIIKKDNTTKEIHKALLTQIKIVKELIEKSYYFGSQAGKFNEAFKKMMRINSPDHNFWDGIIIHTNIAYDNIITKLEHTYPSLTEQDIFYICMMFCEFSPAEIIVCMGYTNSHSASNRQLRIAKKLGIDISLTEFIKKIKDDEISI